MKKLQLEYVKEKKGFYTFLCDCGQTIILRGDTSAKACRQQKCTVSSIRQHGKTSTRLYRIWTGIKCRCEGEHKSTIYYRDKGIKICADWKEFITFESWAINNGYSSNLTIDRINIDGDYSPNNCEWVTRSENTKRQLRDRHPTAKPILLNNLEFKTITSAAKHISQFTTTKLRCIQTALENRVKEENIKPYKGFIVTALVKEGNGL